MVRSLADRTFQLSPAYLRPGESYGHEARRVEPLRAADPEFRSPGRRRRRPGHEALADGPVFRNPESFLGFVTVNTRDF